MKKDIKTEVISKSVDYSFVKTAKLKPQSVIISKRWVSEIAQTQTNSNSLHNLEKGAAGQYNGYLSPATKRKVKGIIENFLTAIQVSTSMKFPESFPSKEVYPTFLTLTLPGKQYHCDIEIKDVFNKFLQYLSDPKKGWNVKNYVWVCETQKNGNLHFHIILDRAILASSVQKAWNRIIERLDYITRFRNRQNHIFRSGFVIREDMLNYALIRERKKAKEKSKAFNHALAVEVETERQKLAYEKGKADNWNNAPTIQIVSIHNVKKLTAYVTKYMTKMPEIIKPVLLPNETLIEHNGKFFVQTETVRRIASIEGGFFDHVDIETNPITVLFESRKMRGRIWGASAVLHSDKIVPFSIPLETFNRVTEVSQELRPVKISKAVYITDMFGERVFSHMADEIIVHSLKSEESYFDAKIEDDAGIKWIEYLTEVHVPKKEIERASAMAGEHFTHYGGVIIPLEDVHVDLLQQKAPALYDRYVEYYKELFQYMYA